MTDSRVATYSRPLLRGLLSTTLLMISVQAQADNIKVAFIGDQGVDENAQAVLSLIASEGTDLLLIQGDLGYEGNNHAVLWEQNLVNALGSDYPVLSVVGNHEDEEWHIYEPLIADRAAKDNGLDCTGRVGVKAECQFGFIDIVQVAQGIGEVDGVPPYDDYPEFIDSVLGESNAKWKICSWHKNQTLMQTGTKSNETGWEVYETCRRHGGIIATGHEHAYSRTHLLSDMENPTVVHYDSEMHITPGQTFAFVSGLGGIRARSQHRDDDWWAAIYTSNQGATQGALFCDFSEYDASCYFKNTEGLVLDQFTLTNQILPDADGDSVPDEFDAFPNNANETEDFDQDGTGNNSDLDDDNDGVPDVDDQLPLNPDESLDTDADGIGNNTDTDDDGDGVADTDDALPLNPNESQDSDRDGIGDNADNDADNDGIATRAEIGGPAFSLLADELLSGTEGDSVTSVIDLSSQGAVIGQPITISGVIAIGDLNNDDEGISLNINNGEYISPLLLTGYRTCEQLREVTPDISQQVTVIDIGSGRPGITVTATGTDPTEDHCDGPRFQMNLDSASTIAADVDGDGIPNHLDLDSDNDSIPDAVEAGLADSNNDYLIDDLSAQGTVVALTDSDADGIADIFDLESDNPANDGTSFDIAGTANALLDDDNDGRVDRSGDSSAADINANGVDDRLEPAGSLIPAGEAISAEAEGGSGGGLMNPMLLALLLAARRRRLRR